MSAELHVATTGSDHAEGSADQPLRTIRRAAALARAGDTVVVHAGEYREWVKPQRGGLSNRRRITYTAAPGERVVIKGSERITGWEQADGDVWTVGVPNALFGSFNPFAEEIDGDWIVYADQSVPKKHLGDVYLNGTSFYEVAGVDEVSDPPLRIEMTDHWTGTVDRVRDPAQTQLVWYAEVGAEHTTIWANFSGADPNSELVEINVRRSVFYPTEHHLDYITVRGFELAHAATPWAPPTADQPGLIGPNWAKGWIIEDNVIHDAKCSAVSLGKEGSTGHNFATLRRDKPGYQYQLESVFSAIQIGWDREHIGSHVVRRNTIYDCGQNAVVGHLGCAFSTIEDNHIYNIAIKREFYGYEIAGIKLHAALDVVIRHNRIHDCSLGTWLDWQTQGTRVSRNLYYANSRDLFIEVSHGPHLVEHNILASRVSLEVHSQGGAFVHNLLCGTISMDPIVERPTPYHVPHSTQVAGYAAITGGDDRYIGNVFLGERPGPGLRTGVETAGAPRSRIRHRRVRRSPGLDGGLPGPGVRSDQGRPRTLRQGPAAGLHPRQRLRLRRRGVRGRDRGDGPPRRRRHRHGRRRGRRGLPGVPPARGLRRHPRPDRQWSRSGTGPLRRRRVRGARRRTGRPGHRPGRGGQDPVGLLPGWTDQRPHVRRHPHPRVVTGARSAFRPEAVSPGRWPSRRRAAARP